VTINKNLFADTQLTLFPVEPEVVLATQAAARNLYGNLCERIAVEALSLRRLKISGNFDACYDAQSKEGGLVEVKSVRRSGACPIWSWRMQKDLTVAAEGEDVSYVFVAHNISGVSSSDELWKGLARTVKEIFVVPLPVMAEMHKSSPAGGMRLGLGGSGYDREGYRDGYRRVSMKSIRARSTRGQRLNFSLAGHEFDVNVCTL